MDKYMLSLAYASLRETARTFPAVPLSCFLCNHYAPTAHNNPFHLFTCASRFSLPSIPGNQIIKSVARIQCSIHTRQACFYIEPTPYILFSAVCLNYDPLTTQIEWGRQGRRHVCDIHNIIYTSNWSAYPCSKNTTPDISFT